MEKKTIAMYVDVELVDYVDEVAKREKTSKSIVVEKALREFQQRANSDTAERRLSEILQIARKALGK